MSWIEPKTDWKTTDYFHHTDFNRINGNLEHLQSIASSMSAEDTGYVSIENKSLGDIIYASEINRLSSNALLLGAIVDGNEESQISGVPVYQADGRTPTASELNKLESYIGCINYDKTVSSKYGTFFEISDNDREFPINAIKVYGHTTQAEDGTISHETNNPDIYHHATRNLLNCQLSVSLTYRSAIKIANVKSSDTITIDGRTCYRYYNQYTLKGTTSSAYPENWIIHGSFYNADDEYQIPITRVTLPPGTYWVKGVILYSYDNTSNSSTRISPIINVDDKDTAYSFTLEETTAITHAFPLAVSPSKTYNETISVGLWTSEDIQTVSIYESFSFIGVTSNLYSIPCTDGNHTPNVVIDGVPCVADVCYVGKSGDYTYYERHISGEPVSTKTLAEQEDLIMDTPVTKESRTVGMYNFTFPMIFFTGDYVNAFVTRYARPIQIDYWKE